MEYIDDTIAAISTPPGSGGIGIIRISGKDSVAIANKIFCMANGRFGDFVLNMPTHTIKYGIIKEPSTNEIIDECIVSKMLAPRSYTCEDIIELNCHGSYATLRKTLELVFHLGARPATPGEFTKRAFLNGRIDLSAAEAVMDLINSKTEESRKAAIEQLDGRLSRQIDDIRKKLVNSLAEIEVSIDYPEYEMDNITATSTIQVIKEAVSELRNLSYTYKRGRLIREGLKVTIAGKPNVGKSSLLNILTGYNRAIVSEIPGTTRDVIEEYIEIEGIPVLLTDTAGIRNTEDVIEKIGVRKAEDKILEADLLIYVIDTTDPEIDNDILAFNKPIIVILNKIDRKDSYKTELKDKLKKYDPIETSLTDEIGIEEIYERIKQYFAEEKAVINSANIITSARHKSLIDKSLESLKRAIDSYDNKMPIDCIAYDIWDGVNILGEITGDSVSDEVIENIFSRFCLGK